jgi:hypothetical protein
MKGKAGENAGENEVCTYYLAWRGVTWICGKATVLRDLTILQHDWFDATKTESNIS